MKILLCQIKSFKSTYKMKNVNNTKIKTQFMT